MADKKVSAVRQNFHGLSEAALNKQINMELYASYVYQSMAYYYERDDVALHGFAKFFRHNSEEEREHAEKFMKYQNKRGGTIVLKDIQKPEKDSWGTGLEGLETALALERNVNQSLLDMHAVAGSCNDANLCDFIESEYLQEQVDAIKDLGDKITNLKRAGPGLGEYLFDQELLKSSFD
jgi:ferritin heavy chain